MEFAFRISNMVFAPSASDDEDNIGRRGEDGHDRMNSDILNQKQKVRKREQIWRKYGEIHQWKAYKAERKKIH